MKVWSYIYSFMLIGVFFGLFLFIFFFLDSFVPKAFVMVFVGGSAIALHFIILNRTKRLVGLKIDELRENHDFTGFVSTIFASLYGVFLAFVVVMTGDRLIDIEQSINREVQCLSIFGRSLRRIKTEKSQKVQQLLMKYCESVIKDEWPLMHLKIESSKPVRLLTKYGSRCA